MADVDVSSYTEHNEHTAVPLTIHSAQQSNFDVIGEEEINVFRLVNFVTLSGLIALFGIFSNAVNIALFLRQGLTSTANIGFFALTFSDLLCLVVTLWYSVCLNPYMETVDHLPFIPREILYLSAGWLHVCFGRITCWITVFITAERCLGIYLPLKVKKMVTLRRTIFSMCAIFGLNLVMLLPEYTITNWDRKSLPARNGSLVGLVYRSYKEEAYGLAHAMSSISSILSFVALVVLTSFLVSRLGQKSQWRQQATRGSGNCNLVSSRDKKTMKMIIMMASVLIVCYMPSAAVSMTSALVPEFTVDRRYANSFFSFWSIAVVFGAFNSSVNIFLYYTMSTKYRHTFRELFSLCFKKRATNTGGSDSRATNTGGSDSRVTNTGGSASRATNTGGSDSGFTSTTTRIPHQVYR